MNNLKSFQLSHQSKESAKEATKSNQSEQSSVSQVTQKLSEKSLDEYQLVYKKIY